MEAAKIVVREELDEQAIKTKIEEVIQ